MTVSQADFASVQQVLLNMHQDAQGRELLKRMRVDAFVAGDERYYQRQQLMRRALGEE